MVAAFPPRVGPPGPPPVKEKEASDLDFQGLDKLKKSLVLKKLRHQWILPIRLSAKAALKSKLTPLDLAKIADDLCSQYDNLCDHGEVCSLTRIVVQTFTKSLELLGPHRHGCPNVNEATLTLVDFIRRLCQPVLLKHGFSQDVVGLAELDQLMHEACDQCADQPEGAPLLEALAHLHHKLVFGRNADRKKMEMAEDEIRGTRDHQDHVWAALLMCRTPPSAIYMSYIHHLALPPLERRYRSYARTIAFTDCILRPLLLQLRQLRAQGKGYKQDGQKENPKERVIWIFNATEDHLIWLAREGYFEDAIAFRSESEIVTIYLLTPEPAKNHSFTGTWPCGKYVKVRLVADHSLLEVLPQPELVYLFHAEPENATHLSQILHLAHMNQKGRPIMVLTCRCEKEAREMRFMLDLLGLRCAWTLTDTPGILQRECLFARNLFSGMASDPDIEYDDNGWVGAVFHSYHSPEKLLRWMQNPDLFHSDLRRLYEISKQRVKWTDAFVQLSHRVPGLTEACRHPKPGDEFTAEHLYHCQYCFGGRWECVTPTMVDEGHLAVMSPEEVEALDSRQREQQRAQEAAALEAQGEEASAQDPQSAEEEGEEVEYRVVYTRVIVRAEPSTKAATVGLHQQGAVVRGSVVKVEGDAWLRMQHINAAPAGQAKGAQAKREAQEAVGYMLIDGTKLGLGKLLERNAPPKREARTAEKEPAGETAGGAAASAGPKRGSERSPAVFWGILDLKYDSAKPVEAQVKVLETGDGRLSRFSGCGASIKESFQHEHKLEETIRRAVITENKKLTHDVITDHGYGHLRPRQREFRREYSSDLASSIVKAFGFASDDVCVLKLCNRARGAGVIPVKVSELDAVLKELLTPPSDVEAWLREQPQDWARTVTWGCFEEQVRHWWTNECPCFLVEECCISALTEKEGRHFDGTMRVGFSLHREHRNKLPPGWVDSPDGPVRVQGFGSDDKDSDKPPPPWNDERPYLDLFRSESSFLRVQWLGGYWKLPIEDINSQDLRGKIVSVAKQGTAPVPDTDLHIVYAALGSMVSLLFGANDMSQQAIRNRYKSFPELGSFVIARLACSIRSHEKHKSHQLMDLATMYMEKEDGVCKDLVTSYIERNRGIAEAGSKAKWQNAAEHFRKSLSAMPTNANSLHLMGLHYLELGEPSKAAELLESVLLLDPDFKAPYACLGVARLRLGQYPRAASISSAGLLRHPYTPACHYNWGVASFAMAVLEEQERGKAHIATDLRATALVELEAARDQRFAYQAWELQDDAIVAQLRDENARLNWNERRLPRDGWRVMGWRP